MSPTFYTCSFYRNETTKVKERPQLSTGTYNKISGPGERLLYSRLGVSEVNSRFDPTLQKEYGSIPGFYLLVITQTPCQFCGWVSIII